MIELILENEKELLKEKFSGILDNVVNIGNINESFEPRVCIGHYYLNGDKDIQLSMVRKFIRESNKFLSENYSDSIAMEITELNESVGYIYICNSDNIESINESKNVFINILAKGWDSQNQQKARNRGKVIYHVLKRQYEKKSFDYTTNEENRYKDDFRKIEIKVEKEEKNPNPKSSKITAINYSLNKVGWDVVYNKRGCKTAREYNKKDQDIERKKFISKEIDRFESMCKNMYDNQYLSLLSRLNKIREKINGGK